MFIREIDLNDSILFCMVNVEVKSIIKKENNIIIIVDSLVDFVISI